MSGGMEEIELPQLRERVKHLETRLAEAERIVSLLRGDQCAWGPLREYARAFLNTKLESSE